MDSIESEWKELEAELSKFELNHKDYVKKLEEVETMKNNYSQKFLKLKRGLIGIKSSIEKREGRNSKAEIATETSDKDDSATSDEPTKAKSSPSNIKAQVIDNLNYLRQIEDTFPRQNGLYLKVILGGLCVSILNKDEKWKYKEEYENFKFTITIISMLFSTFLLFIQNYRVLDAIFNFILVWYYCTLTIRESILVINGSRIKGWWQAHHFITTICTAILLIWPESQTYSSFRQQFVSFSCYIAFVQLLQYYYQKGSLYRLRALGEKQDMDTTVEGFQSWMSRGLSFLLPFLFIGYFWQLYNSYVLFSLSQSEICHEWQVPLLSIIFFVLFAGNFLTTYMVIRKKFKRRINDNLTLLYKYCDWKKIKTPHEKVSNNENSTSQQHQQSSSDKED